MAREIQIRFKKLIPIYLAPHKRTPNRIKWLTSLVDLQAVFDGFSLWRSDYRYRIMLNGQLAILEGHLQKKFGNGILVKSYEDGYVGVGLESEPAHWLTVGLVAEDHFVEVPLIGEGGHDFEGFDFLVIVPSGYNVAMIRAEIEKYKLADKNYNIIVN